MTGDARPWSEATRQRRWNEQTVPPGPAESRLDREPIPPGEFAKLWGALEDALPRLSAWQLMTLHSSIGWERDTRARSRPLPGHWQPMSELVNRTHIEFRWTGRIDTPLGRNHKGYIYQPPLQRPPRVIHLRNDAQGRVLTHELTHDDRGFPCAAADADSRDLEETVVRQITEERLRSWRDGTPAPSLARVRGEIEGVAR